MWDTEKGMASVWDHLKPRERQALFHILHDLCPKGRLPLQKILKIHRALEARGPSYGFRINHLRFSNREYKRLMKKLVSNIDPLGVNHG